MQEKIMQTTGANSEHRRSKIDRFSTLNERIISYAITQLSKLKRLRHCQLSISSVTCTIISHCNQSSVLAVD